jgi:hypothetical protein
VEGLVSRFDGGQGVLGVGLVDRGDQAAVRRAPDLPLGAAACGHPPSADKELRHWKHPSHNRDRCVSRNPVLDSQRVLEMRMLRAPVAVKDYSGVVT